MERGRSKRSCLANLEGNGETEGDRGGSETQQEGRETNRTCQSGPHDERRHLVKPVRGSHRQMLCFFYDNGRAAKKLAASRSFEQLLTLKLSLGSTPELVPPRHTHKGLVAPSFNAGCIENYFWHERSDSQGYRERPSSMEVAGGDRLGMDAE
ncbi:hypothetical protein EYF80_001186 [Liparis tanakae]|uniref:Uncharacterized protein n=1 Tax=Liparis tanakae TaxID=230148 RepID=A0A4Z2JF01_9TELE|nr:hypothetical protein EYF80_001186 [Liparis tanakae]